VARENWGGERGMGLGKGQNYSNPVAITEEEGKVPVSTERVCEKPITRGTGGDKQSTSKKNEEVKMVVVGDTQKKPYSE